MCLGNLLVQRAKALVLKSPIFSDGVSVVKIIGCYSIRRRRRL